jgi:HPt (histidine-containing phosphotransfer) domain-containing protein
MTPLDAPATVPPLDPNALDALRSLNPGDDSFLRDLIQIFLEDSPARIAEIAEALAQADVRRVTRAAHSLKGSSANFGAIRLQAVSEKIEMLGRQGTLAEVPAFLAAMEVEFAAVRTALQALLPPA